MDLETENRLASLLLEEARRLQLEANREGVQAYLRKPNVRHRPNSRFLTATVRGVQQGEKRKSERNHSSSSRIEQEGTTYDTSYSDQEDGLRDDEIERFLYSRAKRGRGAVGSRMDEPGPYLDSLSHHQDNGPSPDIRVEEKWERRVQGPEKPPFWGCKSLDGHWRLGTLDGRPSSSEPQSKKEKKSKLDKKDKIEKRKEKGKKKSKHRHHRHRRSSRSE
uniref:Uncharacterized protein n=1 Tax=Zea mays TaxID=4577 RepID=A0A804Q6M1_MAIZE